MKPVFEYDDYRRFLADYYRFSKSGNKNFSFRYFSRIAGFKSSNFLYLVMNKRSNLSEDSATRLAKAMKLTREERLFFEALVRFNQSKTSEERKKSSEDLLRFKAYSQIRPLALAQYRYFDRWYYSVVRALVALPGFDEDPRWIAKHILPAITPDQAQEAIDELLKLGLLRRDDVTLKLVQTSPDISSSDAISSSSLAQFHKTMAKLAGESIDRVPREERDLAAVTFGVSSDTLEEVKKLMNKFRLDVVDLVSKDAAADSVFQLNIHLFPLARSSNGDS